MTDKLGNRNSTTLFLLLCNQKYMTLYDIILYMTLYYIILHYELASIFIQPCFTYQLDLLHSPLFVAFSWQYLIRCISLLFYFSLFIVLTAHISLHIYSKYLFYSEIRISYIVMGGKDKETSICIYLICCLQDFLWIIKFS